MIQVSLSTRRTNQINNKIGHIVYLHISTISPAIGDSVLFDQRINFAKDFEKQFHDKGIDAIVISNGVRQSILSISGKVVNVPSVYRMKDNVDAIKDLRENGFKHLIMTDGKVNWDIDLMN
jgi:hypothetical protein